jgi:hypothetical protein
MNTPLTQSVATDKLLSTQVSSDNPAMQQIASKINNIGATTEKRFFTKQRCNETMLRELISWLGILSSNVDCIKQLQRYEIFGQLEKLIDKDGYYDHLT